MSLMEKEIYEFGPFLLDPTERTLSCDGAIVSLTPKAFETLLCLVRNQGRVLTKDELLKQIWPDTFVEEVNLAVNISAIRKALGENPQDCRFISTVPGRGYRFVGEVRRVANQDENNGNLKTQSHAEPVETATEPERGEIEADGDSRKSSRRIRRLLDSGVRGGALKLAIIAALVLFLAVPMGLHFWRSRNQKTSTPVKNDPSIAVLPFVDLSPERDQEYFSDGLAEELINDLAQVRGLKVVARSSSFQFKGKNEDLRAVGSKLGVANILEGSIRREGDRVRITAELTKADDGSELWSETYDRKIGDILDVEDEIGRAATSALQVKLLTSGAVSARTQGTNPEAYQAYLQGRYFFGRSTDKSNLESALGYADQAIRRDANYAPAWCLRSNVLSVMAAFALTDVAESYRRAREDAEHAIVLDPNLATGYLALGWIQVNYDWDWERAAASLKKAAELEPGSVEVLRYRSALYRILGRQDEAIELYRQVVSLDPLRARSYSSLGAELYTAGQYGEALATLHKALELNPQKEGDHILCGLILLLQGHPQQALTEVELEPGEVWKPFGRALAYQALGRSQDSVSALNQLIIKHHQDSAYQVADVYAYRGETDKAFEWLLRAYQQRDGGMLFVKRDPLLRSLHHDPRYADVLRKMRLPT
jgi:TolB-like protein/DNA-binding winged helix-turn-helix (wHTH) protein/Flp pilus assembly protein TadD